MKHLMIVALILVTAGVATADDTFGLWRQLDGDFVNYIPVHEVTTPFTLYVTLHDPTVFSVGGYEVGIELPNLILILAASGPNGWTNFGDTHNQIVGYMTPLSTYGEPVVVLGQIECLGLDVLDGPAFAVYGAASPASIPGHDGPVIANGVNPDHLIACGYVTGSPDVFWFSDPLATRTETWTGVKALFD